MKKTIALLISLLLALPVVGVLAESGELPPYTNPFPNPDDDILFPREDVSEAIQLVVNGETITLNYDPSPEYSSVEDGVVQASFYAYGSDTDVLYELYLTFPQNVQPGTTVTPDYAAMIKAEPSVVLIVSSSNEEIYYFSSLMDGMVYPTNSDFAMRFDAIDATDDGTRYSGALTAHLVALDLTSGSVQAELSIADAPFSFTLGSTDENRHADPLPTAIPEDMRKV